MCSKVEKALERARGAGTGLRFEGVLICIPVVAVEAGGPDEVGGGGGGLEEEEANKCNCSIIQCNYFSRPEHQYAFDEASQRDEVSEMGEKG